jgi:hypothetical protein
MNDDLLKIMGLMIVIGCIVYLAMNWPNKNNVKPYNPSGSQYSSYREGFTAGEAGEAASYATNVKSAGTQLLDTLLISKYRSDYENTILHMDDYIKALMLDTLLNIDPSNKDAVLAGLTKINTLNASLDSLNNVMKFVDKN